MNPVANYVKTENGQIIHLIGDRQSFRCRQRSILSNGKKNSLKFVSFKEMEKEVKRDRGGKVNEPYVFDTISRL
jgi:hypothetical protein